MDGKKDCSITDKTNINEYITQLVIENGESLRRFINRISFGNPEYIEEVYQEVWLVITEYYERIDKNRPIYPFLCGIAKNKLRNILKQEKKRVAASLDTMGDFLHANSSICETSIDIHCRVYIEELIFACIHGLSEAEKQMFVDWYLRKLSHSEIARKRNITTASSKMQKCRLVKKLVDNINLYYFC